jgi:hypothetical protein
MRSCLQEERAPMMPIVNASFPVLLGLMQQLVANSSPTPQVAGFMKLICKVRHAAVVYKTGMRVHCYS